MNFILVNIAIEIRFKLVNITINITMYVNPLL
jgi:hypothetical protein